VTETVYFKPREDQPAYVNGKFVSHAQKMEPTVTPYDKATETIYPPKDPQHTNYYNGQGGLQSLSQDAGKTPELNTYDVWTRTDSVPSRESYTPP